MIGLALSHESAFLMPTTYIEGFLNCITRRIDKETSAQNQTSMRLTALNLFVAHKFGGISN